jgi:hypothetical protein
VIPSSDRLRLAFQRIGWRAPQWWVAVIAAAAWAVVLAPSWIASTPHPSGHVHAPAGESNAIDPALGVACVAAMMFPLFLPTLRRVAVTSLWTRRHRAMLACLGGFFASWLVASALIGFVIDAVSNAVAPLATIALSTAAAIVWQPTRAKRRALRACHMMLPLAPAGWTADRDCALLGLRLGWHCVRNCGPLMAVVVACGHHPLAMSAVFVVIVVERFGPRTFVDVAHAFTMELRFALSRASPSNV